MAAAAGSAVAKKTGVLAHLGRHKLGYALGALGLGGATALLMSGGGDKVKPQNGPSKDTYQSSQSTSNLGF